MVDGMALSVRFKKLSAPLKQQANLFADIGAYNDYLDFLSGVVDQEPGASASRQCSSPTSHPPIENGG